MPLFWLSFADADRPEGTQNLGVALVEGHDLVQAVRRSWELGCNPGGGVKAIEIPDSEVDALDAVATLPRDRLLSVDDLVSYGLEVVRMTGFG